MKHIFVIHSNITYLISLAVVQKENLKTEEILFISDGYTCNGPIPVKVVKVEANRNILKKSLLRYTRLLFNPQCELYMAIDTFLKGDSFIAYVPILHLVKKLVLLHPRCLQFHFIEEGLASYYTTMTLDSYACIHPYGWFYSKGIKGLKNRFHTAYKEFCFKTRKIESIPIQYMNHDAYGRKFYAFSEFAYQSIQYGEKVIVPINPLISVYKLDEISDVSDACIWIGDPDVEERYGKNVFSSCLNERLFSHIKNNILYVRFHYREGHTQRREFQYLLEKNNIKYKIINDDQIMELVLLKSINCKCFGIGSTLLIYASIFGHKSYSVAEGFPKYRENLDNIVPVFSKFVTYI